MSRANPFSLWLVLLAILLTCDSTNNPSSSSNGPSPASIKLYRSLGDPTHTAVTAFPGTTFTVQRFAALNVFAKVFDANG